MHKDSIHQGSIIMASLGSICSGFVEAFFCSQLPEFRKRRLFLRGEIGKMAL